MPSPFPGMNPFFERGGIWQDFHVKFLTAINERLVPQARPKYCLKLDEHLYVHEVGRAELAVREVERVPFLEIRDRHGDALVTVAELPGPSNKRPGSDRDQYLSRRERLIASGTHLVEIDLLRGGRPLPAVDRPACVYSVRISRAELRPSAGFWPIALRDPLPTIPIPLHAPDTDARVDLQEVVHRVPDAYGYADFVHAAEPEPPLPPNDLAWARQLAAESG